MSIDTKYINHKKREQARMWFAHRGINPDNTFTNPEDRQFSKLDFPPVPVKYENASPIQCQIDIISFLVYCHVTVLFNDPVTGDEWKYEGGSGGLGVGDISAEGILTYGDLNTLVKATTFEVSFVTVVPGHHSPHSSARLGSMQFILATFWQTQQKILLPGRGLRP